MLNVLEVHNPFDPKLSPENITWMVIPRETINGVIQWLYPGLTAFEFPTLLLVDGEPYTRDRWDEVLNHNQRVTFVRLPTGIEAIIIAAIVVVAAVVTVALVVPEPPPAAIGAADQPGQRQNGSTVYSLSGEKNQNRLNNSIECGYGQNKMWPSYAARPYSKFADNNQVQYSLFCLGHGKYIIHKMFFEDTALKKFEDVEVEVVEPGEAFTLFRDNVITSAAVGGIELFGKNEKQYKGATPYFTTNPPGTICDQVEIDLILPNGLYKTSASGKVTREDVKVQFYYRVINDLGAATSGDRILEFTTRKIKITGVEPNGNDQWPNTEYTEVKDPLFTRKAKTLTPQRYTLVANMPNGRFQIKGLRIDTKNISGRSGNTVIWQSMRAFLPNRSSYGDITMVGIRARASNNLNNDAGARFNVIATRCLPVWHPTIYNAGTPGWSDTGSAVVGLIVTRNPIWAFCDIFRASYGGRLPDSYLSLTQLHTIAQACDAAGITFDYIFDQRSTVWEAARAIARTIRGVPMLNGSRITIIQDKPKVTPLAIFNPYNIVQGSLTVTMKLRNIEENDSIEVEYIDPVNWQSETVLCMVGADAGDNPRTLRLPGVTNRTRAYREGLYQRACELYQKTNVEFKTGLEGFLPRYGDLILVGHDAPNWGQSGYVKSAAGVTLTLSDKVTFDGAMSIVIRKKDGTAHGPVVATATADPKVVTIPAALPADFYFDEIHERPIFLFGKSSIEWMKCVVTAVIPEGDDVVSIKAVVYDARVFDGDVLNPPALDANSSQLALAYMPRAAFITEADVEVRSVPNTAGDFLEVTWPVVPGARHYTLQRSYDGGENWEEFGTTITNTSAQIRVREDEEDDDLYFRIAPINVEAGPWAQWHGKQTRPDIPADVTGLVIASTSPGEVTFKWDAANRADSYIVQIMDELTALPIRKVIVYGIQYTYTRAFATIDGLTGNQIRIYVQARNIKGTSTNVVSMPAYLPPAPTPASYITADSTSFRADSTFIRADQNYKLA